jgi:exodeoxyribonuclease-1
MNAADVRLRLFTRRRPILPEGVQRLPVKGVHLNKSPMVMANLKVLSPAMAQRWGIDVQAQLQHAEHAQALPDMSAIWSEVFDRTPRSKPDVDEDLYGGFLSNSDRRRLNDLRGLTHGQLAHAHPAFEDERLPELLFRYRARNFPEGLSDEEAARWEVHRAERLFDGAGGARTVINCLTKLTGCRQTRTSGERPFWVRFTTTQSPSRHTETEVLRESLPNSHRQTRNLNRLDPP